MNKIRASYQEGIISIIVNVLLFALKYWAGVVSGSVGLMADAWHSVSDSVSSLIVIAGVKLSSKKPDKKHPYGHERWEQIASIFIAFFLVLIAFDFLKESIQQFKDQERADFGLVAIIVTIVAILAKEGMVQYAFYLARKLDNSSVKADG